MQNYSVSLIRFIRCIYLHQKLAGICALLFGAFFAVFVLIMFGNSIRKITYLIRCISLAAAAVLSLYSYLNRRRGVDVGIAENWALRGDGSSHLLLLLYALTIVLFLGVIAASSYLSTIFVVLFI